MLLMLSFPVTRWLWACHPLDLCGWQYLARVLVEGLRRRRPPQWSGVSRLDARRCPGIVPASDARVPSRFVRCPGDGAPRNGRESLGSSPVVARVACLLIERSIDLSLPAVPVSLLPPLPLSSYNRTCPDTLPTNGRVFSWSSRSPSPRRSPLASDPSTS